MPRRALLVTLLAALVALVAWLATRPPTASQGVVAADSTTAGFKSARVYFAAAGGESLTVETREELETQNFHDRVTFLLDELERGPHAGGVRTVPAGTAVLRVFIDDRGLLTLDLSSAFHDGFRGGAAAEYLTIASVTRTLAANLPEVKRVMLVCAGQPLPTLGGQLPLDRPIDVADLP